MLRECQPLPAPTDIGHGISVHHGVRRALISSTQGVRSDDDCCVVVNDYSLITQGLGFCGVDIVRDDCLDESPLIVGLLHADAGDQFDIGDTP